MYEYKIQKEEFREDGYYTATVKVWEKVEPEEPEDKKKKKWRIEVIYGKRIPSERFKIAEIERRIALLEVQLDEPVIESERVYTVQEVTAILQEKKYLDSHEEFAEDMPDVDNRLPPPESESIEEPIPEFP